MSWLALSIDFRKIFSAHLARKGVLMATFAKGLLSWAVAGSKGNAGQPTATVQATRSGLSAA